MSIRTVVEINHDNLEGALSELQFLLHALKGTSVTAALNHGPFTTGALRVLAQRHHSEDMTLVIGEREINAS